MLIVCRRPKTNLNYDEDQSRKTAPRSFQFESTLLLFFIYYISILIMTVISRDCHFLVIIPKTPINPVRVADFL
ncbi:hypothetical protein C7R46_06280 [Staphylococcus aureus]|nr:hypothetical protein C7R46_06280 [Staphylococcus aureus]